MENQPSEGPVDKSIPAAAYDLAITELKLPLNTISLLGSGGFATVGEVMQQLNESRESLLAVNGIGPKTLASIELAVSEFDLAKKTRTYPEPIASLGDHYKSAPSAEVSLEATSEGEMKAEVKPTGGKKSKKKGGKKMSGKKGKKKGKKGKKKGKKKKKK